MASDPPDGESLPFVYSELTNALREQEAFGIKNAAITHFSSFEAVAHVVLLEGRTVVVSLTSGGYTLGVEPNTTFETIEALLQCVSPMYLAARQAALSSKLDLLS
ncbi:hypothetical protein SCP_0603980 [Sparassis crispa]|uniref:GSKIP domain-containing protein n=1 Tax=Sparassis crispa TaxID=139825 RepID=A0A401GQI3_9APHY|nr:hypothetical protein SCP_0603980 [Sparassis crispa]GBE84419.1 hypothetical protein SCP_0603980 [Sparassis crispa]